MTAIIDFISEILICLGWAALVLGIQFAIIWAFGKH